MLLPTSESHDPRPSRRSAAGAAIAALLALGALAPAGAQAQSAEPLRLEMLIEAAGRAPELPPAHARAAAALAFIDVIEATEVRRVHYYELEQLDALLRSVTARAETGELSRTDVEIVRARRETADARATAAHGEREAARARIAETYGLTADAPEARSLQQLLASMPADLDMAIALAGPERAAEATQHWARIDGYLAAKTRWSRAREAAERAFDAAVTDAAMGIRSTEDVIDAREQVTTVRLEMARNERAYWSSVVALLESVDAFGVSREAPPEDNDPEASLLPSAGDAVTSSAKKG